MDNYPNGFTTVTVMFTTQDANGAPVAPSVSFTTSDFRIYKNGSATEKTTANGLTVSSPFDTLTGVHALVIDTSNNTGDANFFAVGSVYDVYLSTAKTVNSQTVARFVGKFGLDIGLASLATAVWTDTTAGDFTVAASIGKSVMNGVALGTGLKINSYTGDIPQTGDVFALANGVSGFASIKSDTATILTNVNALPSAATIATSVWATVLETGYTALQSMRLIMSVLLAKVSGGGTVTNTFRDVNDTKNRVTATVDSLGDRTSVTLDPS